MTFAVPAAGCEVDISDYVGWQIIYSGTVTGYIDENGKKEDDFEGCEHGRILIVDYSKSCPTGTASKPVSTTKCVTFGDERELSTVLWGWPH